MQSTTVRDRQEYTNDRGDKAVRYVINPKETMIARAKQQQIQESFASWIWRDRNAGTPCLNCITIPLTLSGPVNTMGAIW